MLSKNFINLKELVNFLRQKNITYSNIVYIVNQNDHVELVYKVA